MSINMINSIRLIEFNASIIEWDMKRAGLNLIKEFELLSPEVIKDLERLPKKDCDIKIGKMQIKDKEFSKKLETAFTDVMNWFLEVNEIDREFDVLSIKKDACFVINKKVSHTKYGSNVTFVAKNNYHAYIYLKPFEIYFGKDELEIKGLVGDSKLRRNIIQLHENGMIYFLKYVIYLLETSNYDKGKINEFLHEFVEMYKKKELDFDYYREFTVESRFRYQFLGSEIMADNIDLSMLEKVNIEYNYKKIILPLINILC